MCRIRTISRFAWVLCFAGLSVADYCQAAEGKNVNDKIIEIAGASEILRELPKRFAVLTVVDPANRRVTLEIEGDLRGQVWPLTPDAEIKVKGWWGRLEQFSKGDRVWAWFKTNRAGKPVAIFMLADEISQQDIHDKGVKVVAIKGKSVTWKPAHGKNRTSTVKSAPALKVGDKIYLQTAGDDARLLLSATAFAEEQKKQRTYLRKYWIVDGLPGTVTFLHLSGEMDFMLDHEAMRWGRSLKPGDKVSLSAKPDIQTVVKWVRPSRERTRLRLVAKGADLADLALGQRLGLKMKPPSANVDNSELPPDLGRFKDKKERLDWFLASIYCTCGVANDTCTGHFYTLSSCNPNACGMPNHMRRQIAALIDKKMTDKQIFEKLLKEYGKDLIRPHLLP